MKISKDAHRTARQLLRLTVRSGSPDPETARKIVDRIHAAKPRHYEAILQAYLRLLRLEYAKRHAVIESAVELDAGQREAVLNELKAKHGGELTAEFHTVPALLGGIRVKLGSTVWDGSVKARLDALSSRIAA